MNSLPKEKLVRTKARPLPYRLPIDTFLFFNLKEKRPSEFRISPAELGEMGFPNIDNLTGESENLTDISPPDSPSDRKSEGV